MSQQQNEFLQQSLNLDSAGVLETSDTLEVVLTEEVTPEPEISQEKTAFSVSELTHYLQELIEDDPVLGNHLVVRGEMTNVKRSSRGHVYFTLKDAKAGINGILWAGLARSLPFDLEDGLEVYLTGSVEIYAPSGTYSIVAKQIEPVGTGALQLAFQQIKERLEAEGLFLPDFKKPLPDFPERIGIITSRTGAVIHDMLRVIRRKNPYVDVMLAPVKVQGQGAAEEIAAAIRELNDPSYKLDLLIVGRGGGSLEDLFCFSEETVVRAVFKSTVPIITGIGHEPDFSLADAAADHSASTPTAAAERAVPDYEQLFANVSYYWQSLLDLSSQYLMLAEQQFDLKVSAFVDLYERVLDTELHALGSMAERFQAESRQYYQKIEQNLARSAAELNAYSPLATLSRGYGIATKADGTVIASVKQVSPGESLNLQVSDGQLHCEVRDDIQK